MVILIGGISCTGKTLLAQNLLELYKVPYLSIDHLKMGLFRGQNNCDFTPEDDNQYIGKKLWPILEGIIKTNIENNQNIIIEGCYLLPYLVDSLDAKYLKQVISIYIGFSKFYIENNFLSKIIGFNSVIENRGEEERPMEQFIKEHEELRMLCHKYSANYFEISDSYHMVILDGATVSIGNHVYIGPKCGLYATNHAIDAKERVNNGVCSSPIYIGDNVWLGGNISVLAGVTIGEGTIIGAGSVVTKNIPPRVIAAGNPCRVIRAITEEDKTGYIKTETNVSYDF